MKKKIWIIAIFLLTLSMVLGACAKEEPVDVTDATEAPGVEPEAETETYEVALILKDTTSAGWRYLAASAIETGKEIGVNVTEISPLNTQDAEEQYQIFEDQIEKGVDAIVVAPVDSAGIVPAIEKANEAGIPVFFTNTRAFVESEDDYVSFIGVENEAGGQVVAQYMLDQFPAGEPINVIVMNGNMAGQTSIDRIAGMYSVLDNDDRVTVLADQEAKFSRAQAQETMENFLVQFDDIDLVLALNDEMAIGAYNAIEAAGRADEMLISGFDGAPEGLQAILDGQILATLSQDLPAQGSEAVKAVKTFLDGGTVDKWIKTGGVAVTEENAQEYLDKFISGETEEEVEEPEVVADPYEVTLILKDNTSAGWRYLSASAIATGEEIGVNVTEISPLNTQDAEEQFQIFEDQIEKGVDAIIVAPVDSAGIVPAIEKANEAGIPVFFTNTRAFVDSEDDYVAFIGVENEAGGRVVAEYMLAQFPAGEPINVIVMNGNMAGQTSIDRIAGMYSVLDNDDRVSVLADQEAKFSRAQAQETMENFLVQFDDIDLVLALNDEMAIGAYNAIEAAGRADEILISGFDGAPEGLQAILDGQILATLSQDLPAQGSEAVKAVKTFLDGGTVDKWIKTGGVAVTVGNAQEYLDKFITAE
jgi:ABC-type sugar transport system substrate-binding protein